MPIFSRIAGEVCYTNYQVRHKDVKNYHWGWFEFLCLRLGIPIIIVQAHVLNDMKQNMIFFLTYTHLSASVIVFLFMLK